MRQHARAHAVRFGAAALVVATSFVPASAGRAEGLKELREAPLAGVAKAGALPVAGVELLVHGLSAPIASFSRVVKTARDGTWVVPGAPVGLYAISCLASSFRPAVVKVWHRAEAADVSFVTLDLERSGGVLPRSPLGSADPWLARAVTSGDVLREEDVAAAEPETAPPALPGARRSPAVEARVPLQASVSSTTGFGATNGANVSGTSLDLAGTLGPSLRWGLEGQYRRVGGAEGRLGDASHLTLDVAPGDQSIRVSARRQNLDPGGDDPTRYAAQAIDWSAATGDHSRASVSARLVSESNLLQRGPVSHLFARASNAFEVEARYRVESVDGNFVRLAVGYRAASGVDVPISTLNAYDRETHVGGTAGIRVTRVLSFEAGASGDVSNLVRGVMPELTVTLHTDGGIRLYGFAARRFERRIQDEMPLARAGTDDAGLSRLSRAVYRAGVRWDDASGGSVAFEASQRELLGAYRLLLDPEFLDTLDSLYYLDGDVVRELSASSTFRITSRLQGRLAGRAGHMSGERTASSSISRDQARYAVAEAAVRFAPTRTSVGVGYRVVSQELDRSDALLRNDLAAMDVTLAQVLPLPALRALGSEWRALFSLEVGKRQEGEQEARLNRRFSGGLALTF